MVILDEAYVDFASESALRLALKHPHVLISRTFSKGYSFASNAWGTGGAPLDDLPYYRNNTWRINENSSGLPEALVDLAFR